MRLLRLDAIPSSAGAVDVTNRDVGLRRVDELLQQSNDAGAEAQAVSIMTHMKQRGLLMAFASGRQVPKRLYTLEELRLNKIESRELLAPTDETLNSVRNTLQAASVAGLAALFLSGLCDLPQIGYIMLATFFVFTVDQVANAGGGEALVVDTLGRLIRSQYKQRVALHEAGHFLVAYLLGLLPAAYTLSSLDALARYRALNVQAGCRFADGDFQAEVASGKLKASSLERFACVALAGVCTEYLRFGRAEGGVADVQQLDATLQGLQFTQKKADSEVRWAVLNTVSLLRRHSDVHDALAAAMLRGASVGECVALIEDALKDCADI